VREVDELDENIISALEADGRRPAADIARELGLPSSTVHRRIDALVEDGLITIRAMAYSDNIGLPMHLFLLLQVSLQHIDQVARRLAEMSELRWVAIASGSSNLLAEGFFRSNEHLHAFFSQRLAPLQGVTRVESLHVLHLAKFGFDWTGMRHAHEAYPLKGPASMDNHSNSVSAPARHPQ
jgi:Lrp/AsnC family transcriptional regulator for asnA, asnC and gidA